MITAPQATGLVALAERIELWPIDRLRPYERNPRTHSEAQVDQIAASMVEFGWTNPILVDENAGILAGHGRLLAARKLGLGEVPVIRFEHLSEAQKRAYILADNQIALQAGWDDALLAEELAWLRDSRLASLGPTLGVRRLGRRGARVRLLGGRRRLGLLVLRLDADGPRGRRG
jgi:ParB-like chromosome segregation protein Spo0J